MSVKKYLPDGLLPWTHSCFVCGETNPKGLHLKAYHRKGRVFIDYSTRQEDVGYLNIVHGGIGAMLLDEVMTWAAILSFGEMAVAAEFTLRLLKPVLAGQTIHVEGWLSKCGRRLAVCESQITFDGKLIMSSMGKYVPMPAENNSLLYGDFVFSDTSLPAHLILKDFPLNK